MELNDLLKTMVEHEGSDLYLTCHAPPCVKIQGTIKAITDQPYKEGEVARIAMEIMNDDQRNTFESTHEMNLALFIEDIGRFRVNIFQQRNEVGMVIRYIKCEIPTSESIGLPKIATEMIMKKRGLILFVGSTGSGKSTSLAALLDHRNTNQSGHIITIEDPIEYIHAHKRSIVTQREVGIDTESFTEALKNTLRQAPDVILIGEIRDQETMEHAVSFAETGHLCLSTLHANNANQAIDRILHFFPEEQHTQVLLDLSLNLRCIISQRLIPTAEGKRIMAAEVLINTPLISDMISRGDITEIKDLMEKSENLGMQTFDSALFHLFKSGQISEEDALKNADSANNLRLRIKLDSSNGNEDGETEDKHRFKLKGDT